MYCSKQCYSSRQCTAADNATVADSATIADNNTVADNATRLRMMTEYDGVRVSFQEVESNNLAPRSSLVPSDYRSVKIKVTITD